MQTADAVKQDKAAQERAADAAEHPAAAPVVEADAPARMEPIVVPFAMHGAQHTWTVREAAAGSVDIEMASAPILPTSSFRQYYSELDDWKHYLASIRDRMPPEIQRQVDSKLNHLANIRTSQIAAYQAIYERTFGTRRAGGSEGHRNPAKERGAVQALSDLAERDARTLREWAAATGVEDISRAALVSTLRTLASPVFNAVVAERRTAVNGILRPFRSPNRRPVEYRGSLDEGVRGPHKAGVRFNPDDFDLDLFVVDPAWHAAILAAHGAGFEAEFRGRPIPARSAGAVAENLQERVLDALEAPGAVPGLRAGDNYILIRYESPR